MDFETMTFAGLAALGIVNVITFYYPLLDSKIKFFLSFLAAFLVLFVPAELGNQIADKIKEALTLAFAASGFYKTAQVTRSIITRK